jgi:hypothetical protein
MAARLRKGRLAGDKVATARSKTLMAGCRAFVPWGEAIAARRKALVASAPESFVEATAAIVASLFSLSETTFVAKTGGADLAGSATHMAIAPESAAESTAAATADAAAEFPVTRRRFARATVAEARSAELDRG